MFNNNNKKKKKKNSSMFMWLVSASKSLSVWTTFCFFNFLHVHSSYSLQFHFIHLAPTCVYTQMCCGLNLQHFINVISNNKIICDDIYF
jgi:hypothetical protein